MESVLEFLYHATGLCGEHWHPNAINLSVISLLVIGGVWCAVKFGKPVLARFARNEGTIRD